MTGSDDLRRLRDRASALNVAGRFAEALPLYDRLAEKAPGVAPWLNERAAVLRNMGRIDEARRACEQVLRADPDLAEAHVNLAGLLLCDGRLREGFREYEWRLRVPDCHVPALSLPVPMWDGRAAPGKTLLVVAEQGLGDTVQFVRFVERARARVGKLVLVVQTALKDLCQGVAGADLVAGSGEPLPAFDLKVSLLSLPHLLRTSLATLPAPERYLRAPKKQQLPRRAGRTIGIAWQGDPGGIGDRGRSCPLDAFAPVLSLPDVQLYSLQKNFGLEQLAAHPEIIDLGSRCETFADTAAWMESLDLILTTDTAVAHVAAALGRPTWVLLKHSPTWRWLRGREDSPWYPTARLFRQEVAGDWEVVLKRVSDALASCPGPSFDTGP